MRSRVVSVGGIFNIEKMKQLRYILKENGAWIGILDPLLATDVIQFRRESFVEV